MPVLTVEKPLRTKLGDEATDSLVKLINQSRDEQKNGMLEFVEEKFERRLSEEFSRLQVILTKMIAEGDKNLADKIAERDKNLADKIAEGDKNLADKIAEGDKNLADKIFAVETRLSEKIAAVETRLSEKIVMGDKALSEKIAEGDKALSEKFSETKADLMKWMFIFWVGQIGVILGILFTFFKR